MLFMMPTEWHLFYKMLIVQLNEVKIGIPGFTVKGAPGGIHETAPPSDTTDEWPPFDDERPFRRG